MLIFIPPGVVTRALLYTLWNNKLLPSLLFVSWPASVNCQGAGFVDCGIVSGYYQSLWFCCQHCLGGGAAAPDYHLLVMLEAGSETATPAK